MNNVEISFFVCTNLFFCVKMKRKYFFEQKRDMLWQRKDLVTEKTADAFTQ